jgi:hypothetical protein
VVVGQRAALERDAVPKIASTADHATKEPDKSVDLIDRRPANNGQSAHVHAARKREPGVERSRTAFGEQVVTGIRGTAGDSPLGSTPQTSAAPAAGPSPGARPFG